MPYEWITPEAEDAPQAELHLWPYRSLPRRGFVTFMAATLVMVTMPLLASLGTPVLWGLLPFLAITIGGLWWALQRNHDDGLTIEELRLWSDRITLTRHNPRGPRQDWEANPHWVRLIDHEGGGPIPHYITLKGAGREVELGAFLSEEERVALHDDLRKRLGELR